MITYINRFLVILVISVCSFSLNAPTANSQTVVTISKQDTNCSDTGAKILILGTFHMDNPGQDAFGSKVDDVLAEKRQREITEVVEKIARYQPTKILIEAPYRSKGWTNLYTQYLKGEYKLGKNEIEQIGFQLAKKMNLPTLYPVDFPMWMSGWTPSEMAEPKVKPTPKPQIEAGPSKPKPAIYVKSDEIRSKGTFLDSFRFINSQEYIKADGETYMDLLLPSENIYIYSKTDDLTNWYKRNFRIFTNINLVTEFPNDRILLIIGSGHLKILNEIAADSPNFCLANTEEYLK